MSSLKLALGRLYLRRGRKSRALSLYQQAGRLGSAVALYEMARIYEQKFASFHDVVNLNRSVDLYEQSSDLGYAPAQAILGVHYEIGGGVTRDVNRAIELYTMAAQQGNERAIKELQGHKIKLPTISTPRETIAPRDNYQIIGSLDEDM